jgi:hypothetical protein
MEYCEGFLGKAMHRAPFINELNPIGESHGTVDHADKINTSGLGNPNWAVMVYFQ